MNVGTILYLIIYKEIKISEPLTCFNLQIIFLKFMGSWEPDTDNKILLKLHSIYAFILRLLFIYIFIFTEVMYFRDTNDIQTISDASFMLCTIFAMGFKVINFKKKYKRIRIIFKKIDIELFRVKNEHEAKFLEISMKRSLLMFMVFLIPAIVTVSGLAVVPFFDTGTGALHLPLPAWFPFDIYSSSTIFSTIYVYQIAGLVYTSLFDIGADTFIMGLISVMDANIKILGHRVENLGYAEDQCFNKPTTANNSNEIQTVTSWDENARKLYYYKMVQLVINHKEILKYIREFELIFREAIFAQIVSSVIIVCMVALQILNTTFGSVKSFTIFAYLICMLWQIFIYCWTGNEVTHSSIKLTEKAYFCNFHIFDNRTKNVLLLFMERTTREITIMAGGFFQILLSLENFVSLMRASYTYLAILRNVQSGKKYNA